MGCPPTLALFGRTATEAERDEYRAQVKAFLAEPQPDPDEGYPTMAAAVSARDAFAEKYPLLRGCIEVILPYDPMREKRLRAKALIRQLVALEERYSPGPLPEPDGTRASAMLAEAEAIEAELDRAEYRRRLWAINTREREPTPALIGAYEAAFGPERAPELWWAMKDGC